MVHQPINVFAVDKLFKGWTILAHSAAVSGTSVDKFAERCRHAGYTRRNLRW